LCHVLQDLEGRDDDAVILHRGMVKEERNGGAGTAARLGRRRRGARGVSQFMALALAEAEAAAQRGEVPVGAVLVDAEGRVLAASGNRVEELADPTAHAELMAIRAATAQRKEKFLRDCDLYVTLEPCAMCAAAIAFARLRRLYFGADDPKGGGVEHGPRLFDQPTCHHRPEIYGGIEETRSRALLRRFFQDRR
jgi:tRNA(adenine34) deaminase